MPVVGLMTIEEILEWLWHSETPTAGGGAPVTIEELLERLEALERRYPRKRSAAWIPRCTVLETPAPEEHHGCVACRLAKSTPAKWPAAVTGEGRKALSHGRGVPLKVLLTLYRWAHPYAPKPGEEGLAYCAYQATARLKIKDLASESIYGSTQTRPDVELDERATRSAVRKLRELGLVEVIADRGRGRANLYAPHRIDPAMRVPSGLWHNGWIQRLSGPALLLLLVLLGRWADPFDQGYDWSRAPRNLRDFAERGKLLVDAHAVEELPVSGNTRRDAVGQLKEFGLVAEVRMRERRFMALLDPELLQRSPNRNRPSK